MKKIKVKKFNKLGLSEMVSYVILISVVVGLSIGVYSWLKNYTGNVAPAIECKEGTSLVVEDYKCLGDIRLTVKNNGLFNVDGFILVVGNDSTKTPSVYLLSSSFEGALPGHYVFNPALKPGNSSEARFSISTGGSNTIPFDNITLIQLQPFVIDNNNVILCKETMTQEITNCKVR